MSRDRTVNTTQTMTSKDICSATAHPKRSTQGASELQAEITSCTATAIHVIDLVQNPLSCGSLTRSFRKSSIVSLGHSTVHETCCDWLTTFRGHISRVSQTQICHHTWLYRASNTNHQKTVFKFPATWIVCTTKKWFTETKYIRNHPWQPRLIWI